MKKNKENLKKQAQNCYHQECDKEKTKQNDEDNMERLQKYLKIDLGNYLMR